MEIGGLDFRGFSIFSRMHNTDTLKWQGILAMYRFFLHKKGKSLAVKDVKNVLVIAPAELKQEMVDYGKWLYGKYK